MNELHTLRPDWSVSSKVKAYSTTRSGGVSQAPFDALNLGLHVGDDVNRVRENRDLLSQALNLPADPYWLNQVHGNEVVCLSADDEAPDVHTADGAFTQATDTVLVVMTADCLPVVLADATGCSLAVVHAGWRGLAAGVLGNALSYFDSNEPVSAWLGPAIGPQAFEVGEEVKDAFITSSLENEIYFKPGDKKNKFMADLYGLATADLNRHRSVNVFGGSHCTVSERDQFHSHRRDGAQSGRMATIAWIASNPKA